MNYNDVSINFFVKLNIFREDMERTKRLSHTTVNFYVDLFPLCSLSTKLPRKCCKKMFCTKFNKGCRKGKILC